MFCNSHKTLFLVLAFCLAPLSVTALGADLEQTHFSGPRELFAELHYYPPYSHYQGHYDLIISANLGYSPDLGANRVFSWVTQSFTLDRFAVGSKFVASYGHTGQSIPLPCQAKISIDAVDQFTISSTQCQGGLPNGVLFDGIYRAK